MALTWKLDFTPSLDVVKKRYDAIQKRAENPMPAQTEVCLKSQRDVLEHFRNEEGQGGATWPKSQRALREGGKTLQDTGRLRASIRYAIISRNEMHVFSNIVYAGIHNYGGKTKNATMPQRKFMWLSEKGNIAAQRTYLKYMMLGTWD